MPPTRWFEDFAVGDTATFGDHEVTEQEIIRFATEETLFLDDKLINIEAARHLGLHALQFSTVEQLRQDLITAGLDSELPLP